MFGGLRNLVGSLFGGTESKAPVPAGPDPALIVRPRVLVIMHEPMIETKAGNVPLWQHMQWNDPGQLISAFIDDLRAASGGIVNYEIARQISVDQYAYKVDGFLYDDAEYLRSWKAQAFYAPNAVDYSRVIAEFNLLERAARREFDDVWFMSMPHSGFQEAIMAGPDAFFCTCPPLPNTDAAGRRFVIHGFTYDRDVGTMLESYGHRAEAILEQTWRNYQGERNIWKRFTRYDRVAPGAAEVGTIHFAPNSRSDYDWGNRMQVMSRADSWYTFPDLSAPARMMNCNDWGDNDMRQHHLWWFDHLPRSLGNTDGIANNWWTYITDPNRA